MCLSVKKLHYFQTERVGVELKGVSLTCSLAHCHPSGGTRVGVMLPWCEDGNVHRCPLIFICEAVCQHLIRQSPWWYPYSTLVLLFSQGHVGLGSYGYVCAVHVSVCANVDVPLVLCKRMGSVRQSILLQ